MAVTVDDAVVCAVNDDFTLVKSDASCLYWVFHVDLLFKLTGA